MGRLAYGILCHDAAGGRESGCAASQGNSSPITARLVPLTDNPRPIGSIKLSGEDAYRIRVGDYRVIYKIRDDQLIVLVVQIGHRRDVYQ